MFEGSRQGTATQMRTYLQLQQELMNDRLVRMFQSGCRKVGRYLQAAAGCRPQAGAAPEPIGELVARGYQKSCCSAAQLHFYWTQYYDIFHLGVDCSDGWAGANSMQSRIRS